MELAEELYICYYKMFYSNNNSKLNNTHQELSIVVSFFYIVLLAFAIFFYKERLCTDTAYYFYKIINEKNLHVEHQRYVQAFAEFPVLIAMYLHASLQTCVLVYSITHVIFFAVIAFLLLWRYNNIFYALLILSLQLIGIVWGAVNPIVEHYYGTALLVAFYCILINTKKINIFTLLLLLILAFLGLTSHPYNLVLFIFLLIFLYLSNIQKKQLLYFVLLVPVFILFKKNNTSIYETEKINWIFNITRNKHYLQLLSAAWWFHFCKMLLLYYWHLLLILFTTLYVLLKQGKNIHALVTLTFFLLACFIINFSYDISTMSGYIEQVYFLLCPLVLIPFFSMVLPSIYIGAKRKIILPIMSIILLVCVTKQYFLLDHFTSKTKIFLAWNKIAQAKTGCKFILPTNVLLPYDQFINWDMPFVTHLLSAMQFSKQTTLVPAMDNNILLIQSLKSNEYLFRNNEIGEIDILNNIYLHLCTDSIYYTW
jgi:hypothetical protein